MFFCCRDAVSGLTVDLPCLLVGLTVLLSFSFLLIKSLLSNALHIQGIVAGVPFFDEVFHQLDCTYVALVLSSQRIVFIKQLVMGIWSHLQFLLVLSGIKLKEPRSHLWLM